MKTKKTFAVNLMCSVALLMFVFQAYSQNAITLKGRIVDDKTNLPLPFATISIPQSMTGVISNEFGEFLYHIPENYENGMVQITYLGYKAIPLKVSDIQSELLRIFRMEEQPKTLPEVEINGIKGNIKAVEVVKKAIKNIRKSYPRDKTLLYGYYRDYASPIGARNYKNLIEAAVVIQDRGIQSIDFSKTTFKLEQLRYNPGIAIDTSLNKAYDGRNKFIPNFQIAGANELSILRAHDPIRNKSMVTFSFVDEFDVDFVRNHHFQFEEITKVDTVKVYVIHFNARVDNKESQSEYDVDGRIYINSESFAILKFDYSIDCKTPRYSGKFLDLKLEYRNYGETYYLNYLSLKNYFVLRSKPFSDPNFSIESPYFQYRELFVNKVVTESFVAIKPHEAIDKSASLLSNKIPEKEGFWENYNYTGVSKLLE